MNFFRMKRLHRDERGAVYAEFLIAFPIMLLLFLTILQISMMYAAKLATRSAAVRAGRAAVVVIPDDRARYGGEAEYEVNQVGGGGGGGGGGGIMSFLSGRGSSRMKHIRMAAAIPLAGFAPSAGSISQEDSLGDTFARNGWDWVAAAAYQVGATSVTFPEAPGSMTFNQSWGGNPRQMLTTRVTYFFTCSMPIVTRDPWDLCHGVFDLALAAPSAILEGAVGSLIDGADALRELGFDTYRDWFTSRGDIQNGVEEMQFSGNPLFLIPWLAPSTGLFGSHENRFVILRAESAMPLQGAEYSY